VVGPLPGPLLREADEAAALGHTPVFVASDDGRAAVVVLGDRVRDCASALVRDLRERGWSVAMVSGDRHNAALAVGRQIGLRSDEITGQATPEDKLQRITDEIAHRPVVMIGDGVNDAAALAKATVGIAVHGGAEASLAAADVYMTKPELARIIELFDGSQRSLRAVKRCLAASLTYNSTAATLALAGMVTPLLAAVLMPASSLTVIAIAIASRTFGAGRWGSRP
ncbi:MAG: HAD-IC family P-type ATPase, partial [Phycisphaerales bacterium]